jgi:hypothetical protein
VHAVAITKKAISARAANSGVHHKRKSSAA